MATAAFQKRAREKRVEYPSSDGKPMAETEWHLDVMMELIQVLRHWFAGSPDVYVAGNMLMYYVPDDKRRHVSPDVFVVTGVPKKQRPYFLVWEEGQAPALVIEVTSKSTKQEDLKKKMSLYQDVLKVKEYFLFDPLGDYLTPRMQGYRLTKGAYCPIEPLAGRLPSKVLDLHLEPAGTSLRLHDPRTQAWLPTADELTSRERERADHERERANQEQKRADQEQERAERERERAERERERAERAEKQYRQLAEELARLRKKT